MLQNRSYKYKDVDMLMASKTIAESFKTNITDLSTTRTVWTEEYATGLSTRIDNAIETYLGVDSKKDLRNATAALALIQVPAKRDLSYFKTQIDEDFKKETSLKKEILKTLGFAQYLRSVQKGNQESLIQLLYQFKTNMNESLRLQITEKGMNPTLIDNIIGYADIFIAANVTQETFKGSTKEITQEVIGVFSEIYDEIIGICKIAAAYYQYEPLKKEQFTFTKAIANLGAAAKVESET
jgi:hypothetical protein